MKLKITHAVGFVRSDFADLTPAYREQFLRAGQVAFVNAEHGTPDPEVILPNILDTDEESSGDEYSLMFVTLIDEENPTFRLEGWLGGFNPVPEALDPAEIGSFFLAGTTQMADVGIIEGDYEIDRDSPEAKALRAALNELGRKWAPTVSEDDRKSGLPFRATA
ncbi:MAG: hypothetical protein ABI183_05090 [Polyangiaceae bacterium]